MRAFLLLFCIKRKKIIKKNLFIQDNCIIPYHELEITASRSGGPGGQHVNKTSSRITVRWNVKDTQALQEHEKERVIHALAGKLTQEGDLIVHNSASRSQEQNKQAALEQLMHIIRKALYIPKKRISKKIPEAIKQARLEEKKQKSGIKKLRSKKISYND